VEPSIGQHQAPAHKKESEHVGQAMEIMHDLATKEKLTYNSIVINREYCVETYHLYECAEKKKKYLIEVDQKVMSRKLVMHKLKTKLLDYILDLLRECAAEHSSVTVTS
jgi:hypothetical protein